MGGVVRIPPTHIPTYMQTLSLQDVLDFRDEMFSKSRSLIEKKGHDYNRQQQVEGDTLFNLRVCELLGIVPTAEIGILVRLSDKFSRLISLVGTDAHVRDESFEDTICDIHNYIDYLALMRRERAGVRVSGGTF